MFDIAGGCRLVRFVGMGMLSCLKNISRWVVARLVSLKQKNTMPTEGPWGYTRLMQASHEITQWLIGALLQCRGVAEAKTVVFCPEGMAESLDPAPSP